MKHINIILLTIISLILLVSVNAATVSHPASEITAGTFDAGDFTFVGNVNLDRSNEVYLSIKNTEAGGHDYRLVSAGSSGGIGVGKFSIYDSTAAQSRLTIEANGNVGIGTTNPEEKLEIVGSVVMSKGMRIITTTSQPICDPNERGTFWSVQGASGQKDRLELCIKKEDNTYEWNEISGVVPPVDDDSDGYISYTDGGDDCFDNDPNINPGSGAKCNYDPANVCAVPADDSSCGTIDCDGKNYFFTSGSASPTGTNYCKKRDYVDITSNRCEGYNTCKGANSAFCTSFSEPTVATCGTCKFASGACSSCSNYASGTGCGGSNKCDGSGNCMTCDADGDGYLRTGACGGNDCNDNCRDCYPGSTRTTPEPDGKDQNCNGQIDENIAPADKTCGGPASTSGPGECKDWCQGFGWNFIGNPSSNWDGDWYYNSWIWRTCGPVTAAGGSSRSASPYKGTRTCDCVTAYQ